MKLRFVTLALVLTSVRAQKLRNDICAGKPDGTFIPDVDCQKFYVCIKEVGKLSNCPANTLFNPKTSKCDKPENVECYVPTEAPSTTKAPTTTTSPTTMPMTTTTESPVSVCRNANRNGIDFVPSTEECGKYFICYGEQDLFFLFSLF
jgi:hypothetical protein